MSRKSLRVSRGVYGVLLAVVTLCGPQVRADVVETLDGRRFEGIVLPSPYETVAVDTVVAGKRSTILLPRMDVVSIERKPLPPGFFKAAEIPRKLSEEEKAGRYLEVPIRGILGKDIVAEGLARVLRNAVNRDIRNLVLVFRCEGGDAETAWDLARLLSYYDGRLGLHAIVYKAVGPIAVVALSCDNLFFAPGAKIGGGGVPAVEDKSRRVPGPYSEEFQALIENAAAKGRNELLLRALLDPAAVVAAWRTESGEVKIAEELPPGIPKKNVLAVDAGREALVLGADQATGLGLGRSCSGTAEELGALLGIETWRAAGNYGKLAMRRAAIERHKAEVRAAERRKALERELTEARLLAKTLIDRYMELAKAFDPERHLRRSQEQHFSRWEWVWGGDGLAPTVTRIRWRALTDQALWALYRAKQAILTMQSLEAEARALGLKPVCKAEELQKLLTRTLVRIRYLLWFRNRRTRSA